MAMLLNGLKGIRSGRILCIVIIAIIFQCSESRGAESSFKAAVALSEEYDDNIFLTKDGRRSEFITRAVPSVSLAYRTPWCDLVLEDAFNWWYYAREDASHYSNYLNLASKFKVIKNLVYLDVADRYSSVVLEPRDPSTGNNLDINRTDSNVLNVSPYLKYDIGARSAVKAGYAFTHTWYRREGIDRQQHKGFFEVEHNLTPVLSASAGAEYLADRPEGAGPDNNQASVFMSIFYEMNPKIKIDGTAGYRWVMFSSSRDIGRLTYNVRLAYGFSPAGTAEVRAVSGFSTTPLNGITENDRQEVNILYGISAATSIKGGVYHREDEYVEVTRGDEALGLTAGFFYAPNPRTKMQVSGYYERNKYSPQGQKRTVYSVSTGVDYKVAPRVALGVTYSYSRSGGYKAADYYDNVAGLQLKVEF